MSESANNTEINTSENGTTLPTLHEHPSFPCVSSYAGREYIFVSQIMQTGGIETLLVRMANKIADLSIPVTVLAHDGPMVRSLNDKVRFISLKYKTISAKEIASLYVPHSNIHNIYIWVSLPNILIHVYEFQRILWVDYKIKSLSVSGIFHPNQIFDKKGPLNVIKTLLMLLWLPPGSVYFMNDATRDAHIKQWGHVFADWPIHRLAIMDVQTAWIARERSILRIVSVGRIVDFKAYNFGALDVAEQMKQRNISIQWEIWGLGEQREELKSEINRRGLGNIVVLRGELDYSKLTSTIIDYDLFVGMGSAAIEAAQTGIPTVVATVYSRLGTYGYFYECPKDSIGEVCEEAEPKNLVNVILEFYAKSLRERTQIGLLCKAVTTKRVGHESEPFDNLYRSGVRFPGSALVTFRMYTLTKLSGIKARLKNLC